MEARENLLTRRSIRKYTDKPVEKDKIERILEVGEYAASAGGRQSTIMIAVTDKETRDKLSKANAQVMGADTDPFYGAPVVIVVLGDKSVSASVYDGACTMENLMLAAHDEGLGSCWIHRAKEEFEMPEWKEWLKSLGVEGEYEGIGHCILGYTDGDEPKAAPRNDNRIYWVE